MQGLLGWAEKLLNQHRYDHNKLYSVYEPELRYIAKGKVHKRYEFGAKASFVTTSKGNWLVSAQSVSGNPYDGHKLDDALQKTRVMTGITPEFTYVVCVRDSPSILSRHTDKP